MTRFVILATPRCGSNWLCTLLDSHPQILCHHELFNPDGIYIAYSQRGMGWLPGDRQMQQDAPLTLLSEAWKQSLGFAVVGFKLNLGQSATVFDAVLNDTGIMKILISRRNRIRTFVSEKLAQISGAWESYPDSTHHSRPVPIHIEKKELVLHAQRNSRYYSRIRRHLFASEQPALEIEYESLADNQQQQRVLNFLGVDADQTLEASTHKINPGPLDQLISNYADLRKQLAGSDFEQDFDECA